MKKIVILLLMFSVFINASRIKSEVFFNLSNIESNAEMIPFVAIVPETFSGHFVRFIHVKNRKSAVARVIKREGTQFQTNTELAEAIGVTDVIESVFIEDVY